jgi:hypothetical protein
MGQPQAEVQNNESVDSLVALGRIAVDRFVGERARELMLGGYAGLTSWAEWQR